MIMPDDLRTEEEKNAIEVPSETERLLPSEKPAEFIHIPDNIINTIGLYMPAVIQLETGDRNVDVVAILKNGKKMFSEGVKRQDDFWMQHCAASLRELISFLKPDSYHNAHASIPQREENQEAQKCLDYLEQANSFLSGIVHFRNGSLIGMADKLYPNQGYGQLSAEEFESRKKKIFERVCIDVVYNLYHLFSTFCGGNNNQR